jgi:hypothetical protein
VQRDLEHRLRDVEASGSGGIEIWVYRGNGIVCGPHGEQMTREEAESRCRAAGKFAHFCSESDMCLWDQGGEQTMN